MIEVPDNPYWFRLKPEHSVKYPFGVVDGDSIKARVDMGMGNDPLFSIRLAGVDTPEKYGTKDCKACGKHHTRDEETREEQASLAAKHFVIELIKSATPIGPYREGLAGLSLEKAKYAGRAVCEVYAHIDGEWHSLSELLIEADHAYEYWGGTKICFSAWH